MSREIKFRAWDKKQKKMLYGVSTGTIKVWDENAPLISHEFSYSEDCIFEQYTGLKDKNGKEIYEGDILGGIFEGCYIGWCDVTKSFEVFNCFEHYCMACDGDILWCELTDSNVELEVIGNIHENPELLEDKNE